MIYDYFLSRLDSNDFYRWNREIENSIHNNSTRAKWINLSMEEKSFLWVGDNKVTILKSINRNDTRSFYPSTEDFSYLPVNSSLIKFSFTLKKVYTSKGEQEYSIIKERGNKNLPIRDIENPIIRDTFTGLPMVRPSSWKGHLRFAANKVDCPKEEKNTIINRLFGPFTDSNDSSKGRLYFFPTFFEEDHGKDVITPLSRSSRTPTSGPISLEVMKPGAKGVFYLLYFPFPHGNNFNDGQIKDDLLFVVRSLKLMFYTYGFSAKKTSGFGIINQTLEKGEIWINPGIHYDFTTFDGLINELNSLWSQSNE